MVVKSQPSELINKIESPCVRNCCLDEQDICIGCGRSLTEITQWGRADSQARLDILAEAESRKHKRINR